jgi:hypothetical protein
LEAKNKIRKSLFLSDETSHPDFIGTHENVYIHGEFHLFPMKIININKTNEKSVPLDYRNKPHKNRMFLQKKNQELKKNIKS